MTETPVGRFEWERAVVQGARLGLRDTAVALAFATWSTTATGRDVRPGDARVAEGLGVSRRTVERARMALIRAGYLGVVRAGGPGRAGEYILTLPTGESASSRPADGTIPSCESASSRLASATTSSETYASTSPLTSSRTDGSQDDPWEHAALSPKPDPGDPGVGEVGRKSLERVALPGARPLAALVEGDGDEPEDDVTDWDHVVHQVAERDREPSTYRSRYVRP